MYIYHEKINILSKREKEVLSLVLRGMTAKMIANQLIISPRTVEQHLQNIKCKTGVSSKYQLIHLMLPVVSSHE